MKPTRHDRYSEIRQGDHGAGALIVTETYLPQRGGHIVWLYELSRRWPGIRVLTVNADGPSRQENIEGVDVVRVSVKRHWYLKPESLLIYYSLLRHAPKNIPDGPVPVILAGRVLPDGYIANIVSRRYGGISVVFAHGEEINRWSRSAPVPSGNRAVVWLKRRITWSVYEKADLIIANSRFTRDLLVQNGISQDRIVVVHPGADPERFRPMTPNSVLIERYKLKGCRVLLSLGRLTPRKGQDMTLRALPEILKAFPDTVYVIAGKGEYESDLKSLTHQLGVEKQVRFIGAVEAETLPDLYNVADIFIMANRTSKESRDVEGFGIVFLEANACGVPVIAGNTGGAVEAVEANKTGLVVDGERPEEIAQAVMQLLSNRDTCKQLGQQGRQRVCASLTWDHSAEGIRHAIQVLQNKRRVGE